MQSRIIGELHAKFCVPNAFTLTIKYLVDITLGVCAGTAGDT